MPKIYRKQWRSGAHSPCTWTRQTSGGCARQHADLSLGLVDAAVIAVAERLRATAIATLDLRHFAALDLPFKLLPRDL